MKKISALFVVLMFACAVPIFLSACGGAKYTVTFDANKPAEAVAADVTDLPQQIRNVRKNAAISAPETNPNLTEDYDFGGWYKEAACTNAWNFAAERVGGDVTLFAKWLGAPSAVTNLAAESGDGFVTLTWGAPMCSCGSAITGFQVLFSETSEISAASWDNAGWCAAWQRNYKTPSSPLANGTEYTFMVRALNAKGAGAASSVTQTPYHIETLAAPGNFEWHIDGQYNDLRWTNSDTAKKFAVKVSTADSDDVVIPLAYNAGANKNELTPAYENNFYMATSSSVTYSYYRIGYLYQKNAMPAAGNYTIFIGEIRETNGGTKYVTEYAALTETDFSQLGAPASIVYNEPTKTLTWDEVSGALGYVVTLSNAGVTASKMFAAAGSITLTGFGVGTGKFAIMVGTLCAGDVTLAGENLGRSLVFIQDIQGVVMSGDCVVWTAFEGADYYRVEINGWLSGEIFGCFFDVVSVLEDFFDDEPGTYQINVFAYDDTDTKIASGHESFVHTP